MTATGVPAPAPPVAPSWVDLYHRAAQLLGSRQEAGWLTEEASGEAMASVLARRDRQPAPAKGRAHLESMVERRRAGEPLQYVLGHWAFRSLDLMVDARVLIPRPETEQVVEVALAELDRVAGAAAAPVVVDLGTGSGAIALSVAAERPGVRLFATDSDPGAVDVASANLAGLAGFAAARVRLLRGDWWSALPEELRGEIDVVVSNPPYVSTREMGDLDAGVVDWEPRAALEAGPSGTEAMAGILKSAPAWLRPGGVAVLEIAPHQSAAARDLAAEAGFSEILVMPDLSGRDRALVARRAPVVSI